MNEFRSAGEKFARLAEIMATLRGEKGCPWDKAQDEKTIVNFFLEEVYEAVDAIMAGKTAQVAEELGDVLMEVVFLVRIYQEKGAFSLEAVLDGINAKMIRRHPHVFGPKHLERPQEVMDEWQRLKAREKATDDPLAGISREMPALLHAFLIGRRASQFGFDWPGPESAWRKAEEELGELREVLASGDEPAITRELGDLFFSLVNVSRLLGINPELALRQANEKFRVRFAALGTELREKGKKLGEVSLEELDRVWEEIKEKEKDSNPGGKV